MRFSYIDSEGKEIEVDSVESLSLRIELGAIEPDTRMYDAVADRWAPAREHPVFRSLSRGEEVLEEDVVPIGEEQAGDVEDRAAELDPGAGAPEPEPAGADDGPEPDEGADAEPPAVEPEPDDEAPPAEPAAGTSTDEPSPEPSGPSPEPSGPSEPSGPDPAEVPAADAEDEATGDPLGLDFQVTMSEDPGTPSAPGDSRGAAEPGAGGEEEDPDADAEAEEVGGELPLLQPGPERPLDPNWQPFGEDAKDPAPAQSEEPAEPEGRVQPEEPAKLEELAEPEEPAAAGEPATEEPGTDEPGTEEPAPDEPIPPAWADDEDALFTGEPSPADAGPGPGGDPGTVGAGEGVGADADETGDDELPPWAREADADAATESSPAGAGPTSARPDAGRERAPTDAARPRPPSRPGQRERRRSRSRRRGSRLVRMAAVLLLLAAAGTGGAYVLGLGPGSADGGTGSSGEDLPTLPPALHEVMAEVSAGAYADLGADLRGLFRQRELPEQPPDGWLDGVYLSTAGEFPDVRDYWLAVREAVEDVRSREGELFRRRLDERLSGRTGQGQAELTEAEADRVREAALAHYAAATERNAAYDQVLDVADASLDLHGLLVERESDIAYEPYSSPGVSRDPVLEAVPSDSLLRADMNRRVDRVLDRMDDAELPRPITTAGLVAHLVEELRAVPVVRQTGR